MIKISPSLLASDFSSLKQEIKKVEKADYLHLDVMDGNYVPNITFGPGVIEALRPHSSLTFDTHLMIENPDSYVQEFARAGSDIITFHVEASSHIHRTLQKIKSESCKAGVSLNPATPLNQLQYILPDLDLVLIMSVNPGYGGQEFIPSSYEKIKKLSEMIKKRNLEVEIAVDGGIGLSNLKQVVEAGATVIVAGSAIFKAEAPQQVITQFRQKVKGIN